MVMKDVMIESDARILSAPTLLYQFDAPISIPPAVGSWNMRGRRLRQPGELIMYLCARVLHHANFSLPRRVLLLRRSRQLGCDSYGQCGHGTFEDIGHCARRNDDQDGIEGESTETDSYFTIREGEVCR